MWIACLAETFIYLTTIQKVAWQDIFKGVNILFLHIWCLTKGIDVISPNWNSAAVRIIPAFMVRVIAFENTVLKQWIILRLFLYYFLPLEGHALDQAGLLPSLCRLPPLHSQTRCTCLWREGNLYVTDGAKQ